MTRVDRDDLPAAAIVHDTQLAEDPELLNAAGAVALLAVENAELEVAGSNHSRGRRLQRTTIKASDAERRSSSATSMTVRSSD